MSMDISLFIRIWTEFLLGFSALISIVNPLRTSFVFADKTRELAKNKRLLLARRIAINSLVLIVATMLFGTQAFSFLGISPEALQIAGGLVVALTGYAMFTERDNLNNKDVQITKEYKCEVDTFFPLTMPLTIGPGTIAACIAFGVKAEGPIVDLTVSGVAILLVATAVAASVYVCYSHAHRIAEVIGSGGVRVISRLSAIILICIGTQLILTIILPVLVAMLRRIQA